MSKQDLPRFQTCILKVNIHCEGCEHKVRKLLQKTDGVYSVNIDADSGKVLVAGNVDPAKLIKKLKRSGKFAELWGGRRGMMYNQSQNYPPTNQFKNLHIEHPKNGKHNNDSQKVGKNRQKGGGGGGHQFPHLQNKGAKSQMVPVEDQKSVKFSLPEEDFDASDDDLDEFDEYDEFEDYEDEEEDDEELGHGHPLMPNKTNMMGGMDRPNVRGPNGAAMDAGKGNGGANVKKGNVIDLAVKMKGKGGNNGDGGGRKKSGEWDGSKKDKAGKQKAGGDKRNGKSSGGFLGRLLGLGKKSKKADTPKFKKNGAPSNKAKQGKKGGARLDGHGFKKIYDEDDGGDDFHDFDIPIKGKTGKGIKGNGNGMREKVGHVGPPGVQMVPMEHMRNIPAVQGLPAAAAMNGGFYRGMQMQPPHPLPYNPQLQQQQYMAMMMSQQQQHANMNNMYPGPAMMYGRPQGPTNYMGPPPMPSHLMADPITHVFSDENTESCTVM